MLFTELNQTFCIPGTARRPVSSDTVFVMPSQFFPGAESHQRAQWDRGSKKVQNLDVSVTSEIYSGLIPLPTLAWCQDPSVRRHLRPQRCLEKYSEALQASCPINTLFSFLVCNRSVEPWNRKAQSSAHAVIHFPVLKVIFHVTSNKSPTYCSYFLLEPPVQWRKESDEIKPCISGDPDEVECVARSLWWSAVHAGAQAVSSCSQLFCTPS